MNRRSLLLPLVALSWLVGDARSTLRACPFCTAMTETLGEQIGNMDAAVLAHLLEAAPLEAGPTESAALTAVKGRFRIVEVLKEEPSLADTKVIETVFSGSVQQKPGAIYLLMGVGAPKWMWSAPAPLSDRACAYLRQVLRLPKDDAARLAFFLQYLEDPEQLLAVDAYEEFARAPYTAVQSLKAQMDRPRLIAWIQDANVPVSRKRLYLTMLGICGGKADLPFLEGLLRSEKRSPQSGLDALIACYLMLSGRDGMPLIEDVFLKDPKAEYADTYAAIVALRFHGSETDVIPRERLLAGLRTVLDRPQLADLVIPDLARWEDWSVMPRLVRLFKEAQEANSWVRVPVVNYLRACPLPEAKEHLAELEKIDPAAVKRASSLFPFGGASPAARP
jgi:hypothetical protein